MHSGKLNALKRYRAPGDPAVLEAERALREERLAKYIRELVDIAPPLTSEQRDRLATLLRGAA